MLDEEREDGKNQFLMLLYDPFSKFISVFSLCIVSLLVFFFPHQ